MFVCLFVCLSDAYAFQYHLTNLYETWQEASLWSWAGFRPKTEVLLKVGLKKQEVPIFHLKSRNTQLFGF